MIDFVRFQSTSIGPLCTSQFQNRPSPPPGHLTRVKLRTVGNLTQNEARPVGHLTFVSKRLSAVGSKRSWQFFDSAGEPHSRVIPLVNSTWVFLLLSFYIVLSWNMPLFKVWSVGGAVASWLVRSTPEQVVWVRALAGDILLCSWARHFTLTVPLCTQVYKWVPANLMLGGNPAMD